MIQSKLTFIGDRSEALAKIESIYNSTPNFTLIDVGASANPWTKPYLTHVIDIEPSNLNVHQFVGNISTADVWNEVLEYVEENGKFEFLVSTHTIEDISAAPMVCQMFSKIAKRGFIAIPSKYIELSRHEGPWRGFIHHRWIYDTDGSTLIAYPKQSFIEYVRYFDEWVAANPREGRDELQFFWEDEIPLRVVNRDHLGPTWSAVIEYYKELVK